MIVEQIDAFKTWLTAVLKPMCEADPEALAKYVLALVKKDKSDEELRKSMVAQLDVFLEAETETFVDLVFQTLSNKGYLNTPVIPNANPPNPNPGKPKETVKETKIIIPPSELPDLNDVVNGVLKKDVDAQIKRDKENRKNSDAERDDKLTERPLRRRSPPRHRSLSRIRSRSRSWDRTKRSRSREKSRDRLDREQHRIDREKRERPRTWRNKSPPRRYRRASRTPSPIRVRSRSRSPRHSHRSRYRARNSTSRSRSRSLDKRDRRDSLKDKEKDNSRPVTPNQDSNHADVESRLTNSGGQNITQGGSKKRCRDYDEKGYCMSGEMCPFDHGVDPVVVDDAALLAYNPNSNRAGVPPVMLPTPILTAPGAHNMLSQRLPLQPDNPYNPQAPHIWRDARFRGPRPMGITRAPLGVFPPQPNMNRELIAVPVMDNKQSDGFRFGHPNSFINNLEHDNHIYKKKQFDFNRLGPRSKNPQNCSLELKKVPQGMNSITHLNNHFSKFGKIVNIQVQYEGDPEAAIITFSSHAEANAAYRSTEAVLNNRFIKVFWHNQGNMDGKQENVPPPPRSIKDRLGTQALVAPNTNKVLNLVQPKADNMPPGTEEEQQTTEKEDNKNSPDGEATKDDAKVTPPVEVIKRHPDMLSVHSKVNKNTDVRRKQVMQIQSDLRKKKQELLDKQLSQQKILIEKMEKMPPGPARDKIKDTIKKTHDAIAAITKDLEAAALAAKSVPPKKTKEEVQREILDTELDLMAKQQEGVDTTELAKRLTELRAKVSAAASVRGLVRGRGALLRRYNPVVMGRHLLTKNNLKMKAMKTVNKVSTNNPMVQPNSVATPAVATSFLKHTVDHRPTRLLVSGYETDEQDSVLTHFKQYGEIVDYEVDISLPSITLNYKTRKEAELALLKGKHFQDRTLSITWCTKQLSRQRSSGSITRTVLMSETDEEQLIDQSLLDGDDELGPELSEEVLLQDDEEEEEEDRSWRR